LHGNQALGDILAACTAEGSRLTVEQLHNVQAALATVSACLDWSRRLDTGSSLLLLCQPLEELADVQRRLRLALGPRGELLDSASLPLGDIRRELRQLRGRLRQQLEQLMTGAELASCFRESQIRVRNGRYVVPLKADYRGRVKGLVHDESASGQTLYLEPELVVAGNNRLHQLLQEERREERRILLQLTELVRVHREPLRENECCLALLDLRFAAAQLAHEYEGIIPQLVDEPLIDLRQARHPLLMVGSGQRLEPGRAIATDLRLSPGQRTLVISGPNTGGKSVALKSFGLLLLMVRAGLPVPCAEGSCLFLFDALFVDIGDLQSIAEQLSTFSGHLRRLQQILDQAGAGALVLLDEAGTGTDPAEGAALVIAALEQLQQAGARTILTTHLSRLKSWAADTPEVENVAVELDAETLQPLYRLRYGIPGASSAMATARRLGLPQQLLDRAQQLLGAQPTDSNEMLLTLSRRQQELEALQLEARQERDTARQLWLMRREQLQRLQQQKKQIHEKTLQRAENLIAETSRQLRALRRHADTQADARGQVAQAASIAAVREQLAPLRSVEKKSAAPKTKPEVGALVRVIALNASARVLSIQGPQAMVQVAGKRMRVELDQLESLSSGASAAVGRRQPAVSRPAAPPDQARKLVLVGQRVEPALRELERFIDRALLASLPQVEIIHGSGSGALRQAVRQMLAQQRAVTAFYAAPSEDGGENITIAELGQQR
jgi:DNA mismatch repair protein MutS2